MLWLVLGVLVWSGVHLLPSAGRVLRGELVNSVGETNYKIGFAIVVVVSIILMVVGWRSMDPITIYDPPSWGGPVATVLMVFAFLLFGAAKRQSVIKRYVRHPQLTSVIVWAVAHLIASGDSRALILFGGLGIWALATIPLINAREGEWVKPEAPSLGDEAKGVAISLAVFVAVFLLHPYIAGVSVIPS